MGRFQWLRMDVDLDTLPEVMDAGFLGAAIWQALARISGQYGLAGRITAKFASPTWLARRLAFTPEGVEQAIKDAIQAGLVERDGDCLLIEMGRFVSPEYARVKEFRNDLKRSETIRNDQKRSETIRNDQKRSETIRNDLNGTIQDNTIQDNTDSSPCSPPSRGDVQESDEPEIKPKSRVKKHKEPSKVAQQVVAIYHDECPALPKVRVINDELDQRINCRYQDLGADLEKVREFFRDIVAPSDFLNNRAHSRDGHGFQASLPWLMGPVNFSKVANGAYQNKRNQYEQRLWELEHDQEAV